MISDIYMTSFEAFALTGNPGDTNEVTAAALVWLPKPSTFSAQITLSSYYHENAFSVKGPPTPPSPWNQDGFFFTGAAVFRYITTTGSVFPNAAFVSHIANGVAVEFLLDVKVFGECYPDPPDLLAARPTAIGTIFIES